MERQRRHNTSSSMRAFRLVSCLRLCLDAILPLKSLLPLDLACLSVARPGRARVANQRFLKVNPYRDGTEFRAPVMTVMN